MQEEGTILIRNVTRERLKQIGKKGQTYDELINELIVLRSNTVTSPNYKMTT
ncbi:MAG: hypothetical protein WAZ77_13760 [Candidatus Nitrosopolaris sp.]